MVAVGTEWVQINYWSNSIGNNVSAQVRLLGRVTDQSIENNTSRIDFKWQKRVTGSGYAYNYNTYSWKVSMSGHSANFSFSLGTIDSTTWTDVGTTDYWGGVVHNNDGTLSVTYTATGYRFDGTSFNESGTITFPTIPRASVPTVNKSSMILDGVNSVTITTNRKSSSFTHTVVMSSGSVSQTISSVGASTSWTPTMTKWMPAMGSSSSITITITVTTYNGSTQIGSAQSVTMTLTKDTRASTATFSPTTITLDGDNSFSVTIKRSISAFTHTVTYTKGSVSTEVTEVGTSTTFKPSLSKWMPACDAVTNAITVTLKTYNSGYQIGSTKTYTIYLKVDTSVYKPTIGTITLTETNSAVSAVMPSGQFVKGLSSLSASIPFGVSNSTYVTLESGTSKLGSQQSNTYTLSGTSSTKTVTQTKLNSTSLVVTVKDTRGVSASKTQSISLRDYSNLAIASASVQRVNSSGQSSASGTYCKYTVVVNCHTGAYGGQNNTITLQWRYKKHSVSTWSAWTTLSTTDTGSGTGYTSNYTLTNVVGEGTFQNVQYDIQFRASDLFMTKNTATMILYEGIPVYSWGADHFSVYGNMFIQDRTDPTVYTKFNPIGMELPLVVLDDCDDATQFGVRYRATPDTANTPTTGYFHIFVFPYSPNYLTQFAFRANTQTVRIWVRSNDDNGWGAWKELQSQ